MYGVHWGLFRLKRLPHFVLVSMVYVPNGSVTSARKAAACVLPLMGTQAPLQRGEFEAGDEPASSWR